MFRKLIGFTLILCMIINLSSCVLNNKKVEVKPELNVGSSSIPHSIILEKAKVELEKYGINLNIKIFTNYSNQNLSLLNEEIDLNFFQTKDYLNIYNNEYKNEKYKNINIISLASLHFEPLAIYSDKYKSIDQIDTDSKVYLPNDKSNISRSLFLLQESGILKLKKDISFATIDDIEYNPKNLKFFYFEAEQLPSKINEGEICLINKNYAMTYKIQNKAIFFEKVDNEKIEKYSNVVAGLDFSKAKINKTKQMQMELKKQYIDIFLYIIKSDLIKNFIIDRFQNEVII